MTLAGKRIAITRPLAAATSFAAHVAANGGEPLVCPCIAIEPVADNGELIDRLSELGHDDWVLFTSAHAVDAFAYTTNSLWPRIRWAGRCAAVGEATAAVAKKHGLTPAVVPSQASAKALVRAIGALDGKTVLYPASNLAGDDVVASLTALGGTARPVTAYRTVRGPGIDALKDALAARAVDSVAFWSPSAINFLWQRLDAAAQDELRHAHIVCAGPSTAEAVHARGFSVAATASAPTTDEMMRMLLRVFDRA